MKEAKLKAFQESEDKRLSTSQKIIRHLEVMGVGHIGLWRALFKVKHQTLTSALSALEDRGEVIPYETGGRWTKYRLPVSGKEKMLYARLRQLERVWHNRQRLEKSLKEAGFEFPLECGIHLPQIMPSIKEVRWKLEQERKRNQMKLDKLKEKLNQFNKRSYETQD